MLRRPHDADRRRDRFRRVSTAREEGHHTIADRQIINAGADLDDPAGTFKTDDLRCALGWGIETAPLQQIGTIDTGSCDSDPDLSVSEIGRRDVGHSEDILIPRLIEYYGFHVSTIASYELRVKS
jgi:hypothetical protein